MRTVTAILIFWLVLVATGCEYEVPIAEKQGLPVDERVFGLWERIGKNGKPKPEHRITISKHSGTEYLVRDYSEQGDSYYRGYEIDFAGISCIQIQDISKKGSGKYYVFSYELLGGDLVIETLNPKLVNDNLKNSSQLKAAFKKHKDNKDLFVDLSRFRKVNSNESKLGDLELDLMIASGKGDVATVRTLLAQVANVNAKDRNGYSALMFASSGGHTAIVQELLAKGANVTAIDSDGTSALMAASLEGHTDVVQALLANGAEVNAKNTNGNSALIWAADEGHLSVVQALLAKGADVNVKNRKGYSALWFASAAGHIAVVQALLAKGADVNVKDRKGNSALMFAIIQNHTDVVQALIANGADVNAIDSDGYSALMFASLGGHTAVVQALLTKGADVNAKANNGHTALLIASDAGHTAVVRVLRQAQNKSCPANSMAKHVFQLNGRVKSGVVITRGDRITFSASGVVSFGAFASSGGPEGIDGFRSYNLLRGANMQHGALIARIKQPNKNDGWHHIGRGKVITSDVDGTLELGVNDRDASNNSGHFRVEVSICKAR